MATISQSLCETATSKKRPKGNQTKNIPQPKLETSKSNTCLKNRKLSKESNSLEVTCPQSSVITVSEPAWEIEYCDPVPDLYPELSDSLKMQEGDTEQLVKREVSMDQDNSEENVQCVPTTCDDNLSQESTSQQHNSQASNSDSQSIANVVRRKRKLAKPKKVRKAQDGNDVPDASGMNCEKQVTSQETEKQGTWAQCSIPSCGKWRFLQTDIDPQELPERWVCSLNENDCYNSCSISQETFDSQEGNLHVIYTPYPSGAIVWAKMTGYPWWPAMMENDPDYGYYCETEEDNFTPVSFHVVFFDKQVSRSWVNAACIRNFSCDDDPEDLGKVSVRGKNYRRQLTAATLEARRAAKMPLQSRLSKYGFMVRYKGTIGDKKEKARSVSPDNGDLDDSVTGSSSQENQCSSGHSYGSFSSPGENDQESPPKSKTSTKKAAKKQAESKTTTKVRDSCSPKKKHRKKKEQRTQAFLVSKGSGKISPFEGDLSVINVATSESSEICGLNEESRNSLMEDTMAIEKLQPTVFCVSNTDSNLDETLHERENSASKAIIKPCRETAGIPTATKKNKATKVNKKREIADEIQGGKKQNKYKNIKEDIVNKCSKESEQGQVKDNTNAVVSAKSVLSRSRDEENNLSEQDKQPDQSDEMDKMISVDISPCGREDVARGSSVSTPGETLLPLVPGDKSKKKRKSNISSRDFSGKGNSTNKETSSQMAESPWSKLQVSDEKSRKRKDPTCGRDQPSTTSKQSTYERESNQSISINKEEPRSSSEVPDHNLESSQNPKLPKKPEFLYKKSNTDVRVAVDEDGSLRKKCLPKLMKTAFKPPMASKGGKSSKIPKMPKLLKPHFVSPAFSLPESNHKDCGVGKISGKSVAHSVTAKKDVEPKKERELKRKPQCKDSSLVNQTSKREKRDDERHGPASNMLSEDLQDEIEEIDDDITNIRKELKVSNSSTTSLPEETITLSNADGPMLSDSPEF